MDFAIRRDFPIYERLKLQFRAEAFNAFFFTPAAAPGFSISSLFSTHPSLERRLEQLAELERAMGHPA